MSTVMNLSGGHRKCGGLKKWLYRNMTHGIHRKRQNINNSIVGHWEKG